MVTTKAAININVLVASRSCNFISTGRPTKTGAARRGSESAALLLRLKIGTFSALLLFQQPALAALFFDFKPDRISQPCDPLVESLSPTWKIRRSCRKGGNTCVSKRDFRITKRPCYCPHEFPPENDIVASTKRFVNIAS